MLARNASALWGRSALVWLVFTMLFGEYLGATQQLGLSSPHAHAGLLGGLWAMAFSYLAFRLPPEHRVAGAFWQWMLYNLGVAAQVTALWLTLTRGTPGLYIGMAGMVILGATLWMLSSYWPRADNGRSVGPPKDV